MSGKIICRNFFYLLKVKMAQNSSIILTNSSNILKNEANARSMTASALAPFKVEKATRANAKEIHEFLLSDFMLYEPLNAALDLQTEKSDDIFADLVNYGLQDGLSYVVKDPTKSDRIVAIRLAYIDQRKEGNKNEPEGNVLHTLNNKNVDAKSNQSNISTNGNEAAKSKIAKISALINVLEEMTWKLLPPSFNRLAHWLTISVSADYRGQGIAAALLEYQLEEAAALGCQGMIAEATAFKSQNLFKKLGYTRLFELPHEKWTDPATGKPIFECKDGTDRVTLEFKAIN